MRLAGRFSWNRGLLLRVGFLPPGARIGGGRIHICMALVDTGASRTCITGAVLDALMSSPSREGFGMNTAAGRYTTSLYDLGVAVFDDETQGWSGVTSVAAPRIHDLDGEIDAVLGRDVLQNGDLNLERSGAYTFVL